MKLNQVWLGVFIGILCIGTICNVWQRPASIQTPLTKQMIPRPSDVGSLKNISASVESIGNYNITINMTYNTTFIIGENVSFTFTINGTLFGGLYNAITVRYLQVLYADFQFWGGSAAIATLPSGIPITINTDQLQCFANITPMQSANVTYRVGFSMTKVAGGNDFVQVGSTPSSEYVVEIKAGASGTGENPGTTEDFWIAVGENVLGIGVIPAIVLSCIFYRKKHPSQRMITRRKKREEKRAKRKNASEAKSGKSAEVPTTSPPTN